jgi:hypothetical protein
MRGKISDGSLTPASSMNQRPSSNPELVQAACSASRV